MKVRALLAAVVAAFWISPSVAGPPSASAAWEALQKHWLTEISGQPVAATRYQHDGIDWWVGGAKVPTSLIRDEQIRDDFLTELIEDQVIAAAFGAGNQCVSMRAMTVLRIWNAGSEVRAVAVVPVDGLAKSNKCALQPATKLPDVRASDGK